MKALVEPLEGNKVKLSVEVDEQEFDKALDAAFRRIAREVRIPGFRPGKAPRRLLEARIGADTARQEALREALPGFYAEALRQTDIEPIAAPEIDITAGQEAGPVAFDAVVEVRPSVSVAGYAGLSVTVPDVAVTEDEVDRQIDRLRGQFGELAVVSRPAGDGDHLTIDIKAYRHDTAIEGASADDYLYELGSASFVPELDAQLQGARAGDIFKFNASVADEGEATFQVLVKEVKEKLLPEVTDEWAAEASEFDTVAELRDDIRARISTIKKVQAQLALRERALQALVQLIDENAPEPLVQAEVERRVHELGHRLERQGATVEQVLQTRGLTQEELVTELRADASQSVKADMALRALAEAEGIEVSEDEVDAEIAGLAERAGQKPEQLRRRLEHADQVGAVRSDIAKSKALMWLVENVDVVDEEGRPVDRALLVPVSSDGDEAGSGQGTPSPGMAGAGAEASVESRA